MLAWHVLDPAQARFYCLSPLDVMHVAEGMGWTETAAWRDDHRYTSTNPSNRLLGFVEPFRMANARNWVDKIRAAASMEVA